MFIDIAHRPPYPTVKPGAKGAAGAPTRDYGGDAPKHFLWEEQPAQQEVA